MIQNLPNTVLRSCEKHLTGTHVAGLGFNNVRCVDDTVWLATCSFTCQH